MAKKYFHKLDVIRGIAILGVFLFHSYVQVFDADNFNWQLIQTAFVERQPLAFYAFYIFSYGWVGVSIFFVLSGFGNHWSYLNARAFSLTGFWQRRFWRIYPPYLLALLYFAFLHDGGALESRGIQDLTAHLFLVHNFSEGFVFGFNNSFWSIAVEAQFYLLYPLLLCVRSFAGMRRTLLGTFLLSIALKVLAVVVWGDRAFESFAIFEFTLISWVDWVLGAYLAERYYSEKPAFPVGNAGLLGLFIVFIGFTSFKVTFPLASAVAALIAAVLLERYIRSDYTLPPFLAGWLMPLGLCSYSFYLWHEPFVWKTLVFFQQMGFPNNKLLMLSVGNVLVFGIFFAASWCLYQTVESWSSLLGKSLSKVGTQKSIKSNS